MLPLTLVKRESKIEECGLRTISLDTTGSSQYSKTPFILVLDIFLNLAFTFSVVVGLFNITFNSTKEPVTTGTLSAIALNFPAMLGTTLPTAFAAPVVVGTILAAAARLLLKSG